MAIPKFMGIENEYAIYSNVDTGMLVNCMIDYLNSDRLGTDRRAATPIKCFLANGGLVYRDIGLPEYCTPECPDPKSLVVFDKAGEVIIQKLARAISVLRECEISIYKKSSDGYGNASGCHENYSITPELFKTLINAPRNNRKVSIWATFLALRQLITGGGKIGSEFDNMSATFQISQRSDFIVAFRNNTDLSDRPVIHCRNEPWANENLARRLHVIVGETNLCEWALFLKVGLSALMLMALEDNYFSTINMPEFQNQIPEVFPVLSRDIGFANKYNVRFTHSSRDNQIMTATEMLNIYVEALANYLFSKTEWEHLSSEEYLTYQDVIEKARFVVSRLLDKDTGALLGICDWTTKLVLVKQFLDKKSRTLTNFQNDPELELDLRTFVDMGYGSMNPETSLYHRLVKKRLVQRITKDEEIDLAISTPPQKGRALLRVAITKKFHQNIKTVLWDKVILFDGAHEFTIELPTPFVYNSSALKDAISTSQTPRELGSVWASLLQERR